MPSPTLLKLNPALPAGAAMVGITTYSSLLCRAGGQQLALVHRAGAQPALAVALYQSPPYDLQVPALNMLRLSINLTASSIVGGIESERRRSFEAARHSVFLMPDSAGAQWRKSSPSRHLTIYFHRALQQDDSECVEQLQRSGPIFNATLPGCAPLVERLKAEMLAPGAFATEVVDSLARLLLVGLACRRGRSSGARAMSAALLRRLEDYVDANLARRILVADLAAASGLPAQAFAKAYLRYTGRSPHQFVLARRVERATDLLRHGKLSLIEVAAACGFASQQHMTHVLSARLGMAPAAVRGDVLPKGVASRNR